MFDTPDLRTNEYFSKHAGAFTVLRIDSKQTAGRTSLRSMRAAFAHLEAIYPQTKRFPLLSAMNDSNIFNSKTRARALRIAIVVCATLSGTQARKQVGVT